MRRGKAVRLLAIFICLVIAIPMVCTGCAGKSSGDAAKGKFTFVLSQYSNATEPYARKMVEDFQNDNPGIEIDLQVVGWDAIEQKVNTMISTNQAPDLLNIDAYARFVDDNLLMDIEKVISPQLKDKFYDSFYKGCQINNKAYAIPILASIRNLYYNKDIFEKAGIKDPPKTWSELRQTAKTIKEKTGIDAFGFEMANFEGQAFFSYFIWGNGGDWKKNDKWTINSPENIEALQFLSDLMNKDKVTNPQPAATTRDELQKVFGQGKLGMLITANFFPTILKDEAPDCNYGVAAIPVNDGKPQVSLGVQDFLMVFKSAKAPKAIGKFLDYFYDDKRYEEFIAQEGMLPATKTVGDSLSKKDPLTEQFIQALPVAKFYPLTDPKFSEMRLEVIKACQEVLLGQKTAAEALNDAQKIAESK